MSGKKRDVLINLAVGAVIAAAVVWLNIVRGYPVLHSLCNGFFVAAVLLAGLGCIKAVRNTGTFDVAGFGLRSTIELALPMLRREEKEDIHQYRARKALERRSSIGMLLAGLVYLLLALAALALYYALP